MGSNAGTTVFNDAEVRLFTHFLLSLYAIHASHNGIIGFHHENIESLI